MHLLSTTYGKFTRRTTEIRELSQLKHIHCYQAIVSDRILIQKLLTWCCGKNDLNLGTFYLIEFIANKYKLMFAELDMEGKKENIRSLNILHPSFSGSA